MERRLSQGGVRLAAYLNAHLRRAAAACRQSRSADVPQACARGALLALAGCDRPVAGRAACRAGTGRGADPRHQRFPRQSRNAAEPRIEVTAGGRSERKSATGGAAQLAAALGSGSRGPSEQHHRLGRRPDRRLAARLRLFPRRADDRRDEPARPRVSLRSATTNSTRAAPSLLRMQKRRLREVHDARCRARLEPFAGARFRISRRQRRRRPTARPCSRRPAQASASSGRSRIGFIGMTLKETGRSGHPGRRCGPALRRRSRDRQCAGAAAQGAGRRRDRPADPPGRQARRQFTTGNGCDGLNGDILPILDKLDPGDHDGRLGPHPQGLCLRRGRRGGAGRLLTSAGKIRLFRHRPPAALRSGDATA